MTKAKESGVYDDQKVEEAKEVLYDLIFLEPRTFGEFRSDQYRGSPLYHSHMLGLCVKRLKEEGRIAEREITVGKRTYTEFYAIEGIFEKVKTKARHFKDDAYDSFVSLFTRKKKWVEEDSGEITITYPPGHFSSDLTLYTMKRNEKEGKRKSGWDIIYKKYGLSGSSNVKGRISTVSGDVSVEFEVTNSRGNNPWYDRVMLSATFRRGKKEEMRILPSKHKKYIRKIFNSISELGIRSQATEVYADRLIVAAGDQYGVIDMGKLSDMLEEVESLYPDRYTSIVGPMIRDFYLPRVQRERDLERHVELVDYLKKRTGDKVKKHKLNYEKVKALNVLSPYLLHD